MAMKKRVWLSLVVWIFDGYVASLTGSPHEILTVCVLALKLKCTCYSYNCKCSPKFRMYKHFIVLSTLLVTYQLRCSSAFRLLKQ